MYQQLDVNKIERLLAYQQLFQSTITNIQLNSIRESTNKGWCLGNDLFKNKIELLSERGGPRQRLKVGRKKNSKIRKLNRV